MAGFHDPEFLSFLEKVSPYNASLLQDELEHFFGEADCPVVDNLYDWCQVRSCSTVESSIAITRASVASAVIISAHQTAFFADVPERNSLGYCTVLGFEFQKHVYNAQQLNCEVKASMRPLSRSCSCANDLLCCLLLVGLLMKVPGLARRSMRVA